MVSPSNSGHLMKAGDVVTLDRDPNHDSVGVQMHGDAEGVELTFHGSVSGGQLMPLQSEAVDEVIRPKSDGRFNYVVPAANCSRVHVRLEKIASGSLHVAIYSGKGESFKRIAKLIDQKPKPAKPAKPQPAPPQEPAEPAPASQPGTAKDAGAK